MIGATAAVTVSTALSTNDFTFSSTTLAFFTAALATFRAVFFALAE
jgi:hypothetical protein